MEANNKYIIHKCRVNNCGLKMLVERRGIEELVDEPDLEHTTKLFLECDNGHWQNYYGKLEPKPVKKKSFWSTLFSLNPQ